ncbi:Response regulator receiver modulated diguanylate cyclase [Elusimicrobium minutum Pei191]|uniref:Response regulator receiver modulated diguanylate cyclase n=1 Tax=Elusimicrobium minutum (strain Pei191) TaxID=445932 RepID=B2KAV7_ELUMP|nr:response regulator [Elusimicrobium minutum]ACC97653.1 Response regulator receiver modulated diguanylate cyclase [Elusimicrobium minutum Pei191]
MANERILIADDNNAIRELVEDILKDAGYEVVTAVDGDDALEKIYMQNPALCILDYEMPNKSGFDVVREVRGRAGYVSMPIMIFTAISDRDIKIQGLGLDIDDYLNKPADAEEIIARVKLLLRRTKQRLDSNPLTRLPGNPSIQATIESRIQEQLKFAVLYCDLNNFKAFNDKYGFEAGDKIIKFTAMTILEAAKLDPENFVGHIGGDDFIAISSPETAETIAKTIIEVFDAKSPSFYNEKDREQGFMESFNRKGEQQKFPFLSIGIGIVHNTKRPITSYAMVSNIAAELKGFVKQQPGSAYVFDRRDN